MRRAVFKRPRRPHWQQTARRSVVAVVAARIAPCARLGKECARRGRREWLDCVCLASSCSPLTGHEQLARAGSGGVVPWSSSAAVPWSGRDGIAVGGSAQKDGRSRSHSQQPTAAAPAVATGCAVLQRHG